MRYLSGETEAERLLTACDEWLKPIVTTALHTGMRKGELLGLTWDCVDMTHGFIRLKQTKNGKARALPLNETLWSLFSGLRTRHDVPCVFHDWMVTDTTMCAMRSTERVKPPDIPTSTSMIADRPSPVGSR